MKDRRAYGATKNSGNIAKQTVSFSGLANPFIQTYKYDSLDRITEAKETVNGTQTWIQNFGFDQYGNRNSFSQNVGGQQLAINNLTLPSVDATTNRFNINQGYGYDKNGNITTDPANSGRTFVFDGDNKQTQVKNSSNVTIGTYSYDGNGKRVKKVTDLETTIFVYDASNKLVAEYSTIVEPTATAKVNYLTNDHLGSPRITTDAVGQVVSRRDFMPFGEEISRANYGSDNIRQKFTGYERDGETELDFAQARYYSSVLGRFSIPDPIYLEMKRLLDPQQINIYLYARNNPLKFTDVNGLDIGIDGEEQQWALERLKDGLSFANQVTLTKNKVAITDKDGRVLDPTKKADKKILNEMAKGLKGAEKDLFKAIVDPKTHATLTAVKSSTDVDIGENKSPGNNSVDRSEAELFDKGKGAGGGLNSSNIVKHEAMEAYLTAKTGKSLLGVGGGESPHTNNPFPGVIASDFSAAVGSRIASFSARMPGVPGSYYVQKQLITPIPPVGLPQKAGTITSVVFIKP